MADFSVEDVFQGFTKLSGFVAGYFAQEPGIRLAE
jgi:hypothetical protein